jgi:hypothetical protein
LSLEIGTWTERQVNSHWIAGTLDDIGALGAMVETALQTAAPGNVIDIGWQYLPTAEAKLELHVAPDAFDPPTADAACW